GLELQGSMKTAQDTALDTIAFSGRGAQRNRIEHCIVHGPTNGDAVSVESTVGTPAGSGNDNVVADSEITGAEDRGIKVTTGAYASIVNSCIHDNRNGGIQATDGGNVTAVRNVIQLNRFGKLNGQGDAENGLGVGVPDPTAPLDRRRRDLPEHSAGPDRLSGGRRLPHRGHLPRGELRRRDAVSVQGRRLLYRRPVRSCNRLPASGGHWPPAQHLPRGGATGAPGVREPRKALAPPARPALSGRPGAGTRPGSGTSEEGA